MVGGYTTCGHLESGGTECWGPLSWIAVAHSPGGAPFSTLSLGSTHLCGIAAEGGAYCWGDNFDGQLGIGLIDRTGYLERQSPTAVAGGARYHSIATDNRVSCALSAEGQPFCWGLGHTFGAEATPRAVAGISMRFDTLVMGTGSGADHECGLTAAREIFCWGWSTDGQAGAVPAFGNTPGAIRVVLPGGAMPVAITAGGDDVEGYTGHSCALSSAGEAFCWGSNRYGQLGNGTTTPRPEPLPVSGGHRFTQLAAGGNHTCGVTASAELYCWGRNRSGQLGNGKRGEGEISAVPVRVAARS